MTVEDERRSREHHRAEGVALVLDDARVEREVDSDSSSIESALADPEETRLAHEEVPMVQKQMAMKSASQANRAWRGFALTDKSAPTMSSDQPRTTTEPMAIRRMTARIVARCAFFRSNVRVRP